MNVIANPFQFFSLITLPMLEGQEKTAIHAQIAIGGNERFGETQSCKPLLIDDVCLGPRPRLLQCHSWESGYSAFLSDATLVNHWIYPRKTNGKANTLFLVAMKRLYKTFFKRACSSVGPSVGPSVRCCVGPSVGRSVMLSQKLQKWIRFQLGTIPTQIVDAIQWSDG